MDKFLLQSRFQQLHKVRTDQPTIGLEARKEELKGHRKSSRNNLMALKRNITEMSPFQEHEAAVTKKPSLLEQKMEEKRQQLKIWQHEKKKRLQQQKMQSKPLFKFHHLTVPIGAPDLENVNKVIKGKRFITKRTAKDATISNYTFAPANYKFKGPNIESLKTKQSTSRVVRNPETTNRKVLFGDVACGSGSSGVQYKKTPAKVNNRNRKKPVEQLYTASPTIATRLRSKTTLGGNDDKIVREAISTKKGKSKVKSECFEQEDVDLNKENEFSGKKRGKNVTKSVTEASLKTLTARSPVAEGSYRKTPRRQRKSPLVELNTICSPEKLEYVETQDDSTNDKEKRKNSKSAVKVKKTRRLIRSDAVDEDQQTPAKHRKSAVISSSEGIEHQEYSTKEDPPKTPIDGSGTPQNKTLATEEKPRAYVSPFVTITRGKSNARKEFQLRSSQGGLFDLSPEMKKATGIDAAVAYFHQLLDDEIERIQGLCDNWIKYKDEEDPPEDACDMINVAVGQSQLLINKKFKQFRGLINDCKTGDADPPITCMDLHGYWDTAYIQVDNLDKRFENLDNLRKNDWEEILPMAKKEEVKKGAAKRGRKVKAKATSSLRELIKAQRRKAASEQPEEGAAGQSEMAENVKMATPSKPERSVGRPRSSALTSEASRRVSSPGLVILKVARKARSVERRADFLSEGTPGRSILKSHKSKSTTKKSVVFKEVQNGGISPELEDNGRRKSKRLSRVKLFS